MNTNRILVPLIVSLSGILLTIACRPETSVPAERMTLWTTDTLSGEAFRIVPDGLTEDSLLLSGSLEIRVGDRDAAGDNGYLWFSLLGCAALLAVTGGFWYKRRSYRKRITSLSQENQATRQVLTRHLDEACRKRRQFFELSVSDSSIYKEIKLLVEENRDRVHNSELLSAGQWQELFAAIDSRSDDFSLRLSRQFAGLKPEDIRFCCLLKIGLKYQEIACLLGRTTNMMYKRRAIIVRRMALTAEQLPLEEYVRNM